MYDFMIYIIKDLITYTQITITSFIISFNCGILRIESFILVK